MTARERVKLVLEHKMPDRLPIDIGGSRGTSISGEAYLRLRDEVLGKTDKKPYMYDFAQQLVYPEDWFLKRFNIDIIDGGQAFINEEKNCQIWTLNSGREVLVPGHFRFEKGNDDNHLLYDFSKKTQIAIKEKASLYFTQNFWVYEASEKIPEIINYEDLDKNLYGLPIHPWDVNLEDSNEYEAFIKKIKTLHRTTESAISLTVGCQFFEMGQYIRGMENFFCDLYLDTVGVQRLLDRLLEKYMLKLKKIIEGVGDYVDIIRFVDDLGSQQALLLNPEKYREIIKPYHKHMWDYIHKNSNCKVALHSCGSITDILPDLIDAGVDVLNPVQTSCANMDPRMLKKEFGKDIVFWGGGCDTQSILPTKTPKEIKKHVKDNIEIFAEGGGMIFSQIHNIQADVPPENITAMLDAAFEYGIY